MPRRALVAAALLVALATASPAAADLGGYVITRFHTDLSVEPNAELLVEERLEVDFSEQRHGIYRHIPVRYTDPRGFGYSIGLRVLDVTDENGRSWQTKITSERQYIKIRIGDPDRTVTGRQVYVIRYRVRDAVAHLSEHDELYWNAVGDEWQTTIESASATVHLPASLEPEELTWSAYSGTFGSRESDVTVDQAVPDEVAFDMTRALAPREGLTVAVAWPHGIVTFPSALDRWLRRLVDNWILIVPLVALATLYRRYRTSGRDPLGTGPVTVRYEPPAGVGPSEVGTIVDENVDMADITATVVNLAVRGFLTIGVEERKGLLGASETSVFERRPDLDTSELRPHEQKVLDGLFEEGDHVTSEALRERFYVHIPHIRAALYARLTEQGFFAANPDDVRTRYAVSGFLLGLAAFAVGLLWAWWRGILMPYALVAPTIAGVLTAVLYFGFARAMPSRTAEGVRLRGWALGFQEFVDRVEADRLERAEARNAFESLLPYAMALGVAATWARKFEGIYEEAGPTWYVGPHTAGHFSTRTFESSLSSAMSATAKTMAQAPRSSGSSGAGGGGFSGGGFGGGGGGSW